MGKNRFIQTAAMAARQLSTGQKPKGACVMEAFKKWLRELSNNPEGDMGVTFMSLIQAFAGNSRVTDPTALKLIEEFQNSHPGETVLRPANNTITGQAWDALFEFDSEFRLQG